MNKALSKAFMHRARLKNRYHRFPTERNKTLYKKQRNFCVGLLKKEKRSYYNNLDLKVFKDNKSFWKTIKPLFSDKAKSKTNITLIDKEKVFIDKNEVAEVLNTFFIEAVQSLEIERFNDGENEIQHGNIDEVIDNIITNYKQHPSILKIKENVKVETKFKFTDTTGDEIYSKIKSLDPKKASMENDIPAKMLIGTNDIISAYISKMFNESKNSESFPNSLKTADITPIYKEKEKTSKKNYRPVSILPVVSKLYEENMYEQMSSYANKFLSPYLFGYRKGHGTHCLLVMIEMWRKALDEKR